MYENHSYAEFYEIAWKTCLGKSDFITILHRSLLSIERCNLPLQIFVGGSTKNPPNKLDKVSLAGKNEAPLCATLPPVPRFGLILPAQPGVLLAGRLEPQIH